MAVLLEVVALLTTGKVLRFDEVPGYGFIAPAEAGEDVFMHANDLIDEKYLYQEGSEVEFFLEAGDKGPKASQIRTDLTEALLESVGTLTADQIKQVRESVVGLVRARGLARPLMRGR
jgi:cold shock CspA family protein